MRGRAVGHLVLALFVGAAPGCASARLPEPEQALAEYRRALSETDVETLWQLLTEEARQDLGRHGLARLVEDQREELLARSDRLASPHASIESRATLFLTNGQLVTFRVENGHFRLQEGAGIPHRTQDPLDAARELRAALHARDSSRARAVLSERGRARLDAVFSGLGSALEELESGVLEIRGEHAELSLPDGRRVQFRREHGMWKVEEVH